ncbi:MAG: adenylosuccinate lyase [Syntrophomonadaceae bacterium]|jgi:adenylosuccinate lyase|nr:adenylosuccinate lyase [Syntrophomonadaceae bacterium]
MISRYALQPMAEIWEEEYKLNNWLRIEIAACEAWGDLGKIPAAAVEAIKEKAEFNTDRIKEIENQVHHDVIAFLTNVGEYVGENSKYIHLGMTSSDILDTGLAMQMRDAGQIILSKLKELLLVTAEKAKVYKYTLTIGRTHGVHGEPTTFGLKMALWHTEIERAITRMEQATEVISYGAVSGAVGNFAHLDPYVEEYVCRKLGLKPCPVSTQIIQRDRHAQYMTALALTAGSLEKMATEIRNLQRTEILEAEEPFHSGQKGSSAMPHKRNPMISERVVGLSRVIRGNALAAMENISLWHERDLTHSSVERVIIPDSCILLDYILDRFIKVVKGLVIYEDNMQANIYKNRGLVFSQELMLTLIGKGMRREAAYEIVQRCAMQSWSRRLDFRGLLEAEPEINGRLTAEELDTVFDLAIYKEKVDYIFKRCGLA